MPFDSRTARLLAAKRRGKDFAFGTIQTGPALWLVTVEDKKCFEFDIEALRNLRKAGFVR